MSVSRNNELLRANQSYSTKMLFYFVSIALGSLQYWTALLYHETDPDFALDFTNAHENYYDNPIVDKGMDLTNNHFAHSYCESWNLPESSYSRVIVSDHILELIEYGYLIYIICFRVILPWGYHAICYCFICINFARVRCTKC